MPTTGESVRLARLFSGGQNAVVVAIDHGLYMGPLPGLINPAGGRQPIGGADAILLTSGMAQHCQAAFSRRGAPAMILRLNWASNYVSPWNYKHSHSVPMLSVDDAVAQGADIVLASVTLRNPDEAEDTGNVETFSAFVAREARPRHPLDRRSLPHRGR